MKMTDISRSYIIECDSEEIQNLNTYLSKYDLVVDKEHYILRSAIEIRNYSYKDREKYLWIPTGDQLDDEIEKIVRRKDNYSYKTNLDFRGYSTEVLEGHYSLGSQEGDNRYIIKIKLLKELLGVK